MKKIIRFVLRRIPRRILQRFVRFAMLCCKPFYLGNKKECPVCGKHYRKFLPYGYVVSRENALCPNCLALERHRLLWLFLQEKTNLFTENLSFLHIAPEICFIDKFKKLNNLNYKTADLESPWADIHLNIEEMPLEDSSFDVLMANHILEHVEHLDKALSEIYRVLKVGGWAILLSPINPKRETTYEDASITDPLEREKHFGQKDHVREFGKDYAQVLASAGFEVEESDFASTLSKEVLERMSLASEDVSNIVNHIFVVHKPKI